MKTDTLDGLQLIALRNELTALVKELERKEHLIPDILASLRDEERWEDFDGDANFADNCRRYTLEIIEAYPKLIKALLAKLREWEKSSTRLHHEAFRSNDILYYEGRMRAFGDAIDMLEAALEVVE